jgi:hypothetical protein
MQVNTQSDFVHRSNSKARLCLYNAPPNGQSIYFTGDNLKYGYTIRNLTALQALDAVRRLIIQG